MGFRDVFPYTAENFTAFLQNTHFIGIFKSKFLLKTRFQMAEKVC